MFEEYFIKNIKNSVWLVTNYVLLSRSEQAKLKICIVLYVRK